MENAETDNISFDSIEDAIAEIAKGNLVIVTDDQSRENEGDLVMAASKVTPQSVNMMILNARGLICVPTLDHQLRHLGIDPMVQRNREAHQTDFTVSVDASTGITTGISAYDRATTIKILANPKSTPEMLVQPGHVFPLRAKPGGVLERAGHTEAAVDLASLAGLHPSGVICEILNEDGTCARLPELQKFKEKFGLKMISIADLIQFRHKSDKLVDRVACQQVSTQWGEFELHVFRNILDNRHHLALSMGKLDDRPTLVRVQSENLLSDIFQVSGTIGHNAIEASMKMIAEAKHGVILYIEKPNGGINIEAITQGSTSNESILTSKMDFRDYGIGAQILAQLGLKKIRLISGRHRKVIALDGYELEIVEQIPLTSCDASS